MAIDAIREHALAMSESERGELAAELLASLAPPAARDEAETRDAWTKELARRAERMLSGKDPGELWEDVEARLRNELNA